MTGRVEAVAFDVLETLLDLDPIETRLEDVGQPAAVLGPFFMRFQRDAMALTLAGDNADFTATARQALRTETKQTMSTDDIDHVLQGFANVPAFPDALPALRTLSEAGVKIGCLTVGDPDNTRSFLAGAGLETYVDHVVTSDVVGTWKPAPAVYHHTAKALGCELECMALVAVHAWDCHGAKRAGALAGWCSRLEGEPGDVFQPADVRGDDLVEVVNGLLPCELTAHCTARGRSRGVRFSGGCRPDRPPSSPWTPPPTPRPAHDRPGWGRADALRHVHWLAELGE